jgi:hypothetical protein
MGLIGKAWNIATSFVPFGGVINKVGRHLAKHGSKAIRNYVADHGGVSGIIGKVGGHVAREFVPEHIRNTASKVADTVIEALPDNKIKKHLSVINEHMQSRAKQIDKSKEKSNEYKKSSATINPAQTGVYGHDTVRKPPTAGMGSFG